MGDSEVPLSASIRPGEIRNDHTCAANIRMYAPNVLPVAHLTDGGVDKATNRTQSEDGVASPGQKAES
jgi:hypothetical protein